MHAPERENMGQSKILPAGSLAPPVHPPARGVRRGGIFESVMITVFFLNEQKYCLNTQT